MVKPKQLGHIVLRVRDLERSEQFYSDVLGLHVTNKRPGRMTFMSAVEESSHELALVPVGDDAPGPEENASRPVPLRLADGLVRRPQEAVRRDEVQGR